MITGETEFLMTRDPEDDSYDNFLGFGKKAKARREQRRADRKAEVRKPGQGLMDFLGSEGLGNTLNNVSALFSKKGDQAPSDYEVSVGGSDYDDSNLPPEKDNTMLIVGGVIIAGILVLGYTQMKKNKTMQPAL